MAIGMKSISNYDYLRYMIAASREISDEPKILDGYMQIPDAAIQLLRRSFLNDKMKRNYLRIITERTNRFTRKER
jgi:hypothetical protein